MSERLLWARLYASKDHVATLAALRKDLLPVFARALGRDRASAAFEQLLDEQAGAGHVLISTGKSPKARLRAAGVEEARALVPHSAGKTWSVIAKTELAAHALGIHARLSSSGISALSKATVLQLVILAQHFELGVPLPPTAAQVEQALLWEGMRRGLTDTVYDWARDRKPGLPLVVSVVAASWGEVRPSAKKAEVFARIAANVVGAKNAKDLHAALLPRLVAGTRDSSELGAGTLRAAATTPPKSHEESATRAGNGDGGTSSREAQQRFAAQVLESARRSPSGKLDASLILINHAYAQFSKEHPDAVGSLDAFKRSLWSTAVNGFLTLASADMPQVLDRDDYSQSRIEQGASVYALIRI